MRIFDLMNVTYSYRPQEPAIINLQLSIEAGEKMVLLGPNGCGKSTLQKILAGLIVPQQGVFQAFGHIITAKSMREPAFAAVYRQKVGFVFQNSDVQTFCASVVDEIMFGPMAMGMGYPEALLRAQELMDLLGIQALSKRLPHHLSGGEKKKVAIAAVLAVNPEVLILDEPTNGLDPKTQRWLLRLIHDFHAQGKTVITATHQLDLVMELADRVIVMGEERRVLADDVPEKILTNHPLLLEANVIDEWQHVHLHGEDKHIHVHRHT